MIYTNLFKPNKSNKVKTAIYYMVESRRYKFNIIFDKKFTSVLSGMALGTFMIASINVGIYLITTTNNSRILLELESENTKYIDSLAQLESQKAVYENQKINADNIYNISDKPTKWSSIIESIAEQLPYDTVLTSVTTTNSDDFSENNDSGVNNSDSSNVTDNTSNPNTDSSTDGATNTENTTTDNSNNNGTENNSTGSAQNTLEEQISENKNIVENNIITITGKSLSMVNLSLFLDKLDKLDIFSKVECSYAEKESDSDYYGFIIYAFLN